MHGGKSLRGPAHPNWKGNRYKPHLEGSPLLESYEQAIADPEILNLSQEMAVIQARIGQLLGNVLKGESGLLAEKMMATWKEVMSARRRRDSATYAEKMEHLGSLFSDAVRQRNVWEEIYEAIDLLRKVQHREQRRRVEMHAMLTSEQAIGLMSEMVDLVKQNVTDEKALKEIRQGMRAILVRRPALHSGLSAAQKEPTVIPDVREVETVEGEIIDVEEIA